MSRNPPRKGIEFYRIALTGRKDKGPDDFRGLRSYADGFDPGDGYDLHKFDEWTPQQKGKLTRYFNATMELTSRAHKVIRPRNKKNLGIIQQASQHPDKLPALKVAFLPVQSDAPIRIKVSKSGKVIVKGEHYSRQLLNFNKRALIRDPDAEVKRLTDSAPHAKTFKIQAGVYEVRNMFDAKTIGAEVKKLMAKYDGKTITDAKKNPRHHHHKQWLDGLVAYSFDRQGDPAQLQRDMAAARESHRQARRRQSSGISRALWEPLGEQEYHRAGGNMKGGIHWDDLPQRMRDLWVAQAKYKHSRRK